MIKLLKLLLRGALLRKTLRFVAFNVELFDFFYEGGAVQAEEDGGLVFYPVGFLQGFEDQFAFKVFHHLFQYDSFFRQAEEKGFFQGLLQDAPGVFLRFGFRRGWL